MNIKKIIYNWVKENFGESEADDPSWNIELLAGEIESKLNDKLGEVDNLCDSIKDKCEQILDDIDLLNTLSLVRDIKNDSQEIQKTIKKGV